MQSHSIEETFANLADQSIRHDAKLQLPPGQTPLPEGENPRAFDNLKRSFLFRGKKGRNGRNWDRKVARITFGLSIQLRSNSKSNQLHVSRWVDFIKEKGLIFHTNLYILNSNRCIIVTSFVFLVQMNLACVFIPNCLENLPWEKARESEPKSKPHFISRLSVSLVLSFLVLPGNLLQHGGLGASKNNSLRIEHKTCVFWNSGPLYCGKYDGYMSKQDYRCWWWRQGNWIRSFRKAVRFSCDLSNFVCAIFSALPRAL